jgi:hypothetical protein
MIEILEKLFGGAAKVKIMRLFVFNPGVPFDSAHIMERSKVTLADARRETQILEKMDLIRKRSYFKEVTRKRGKNTTIDRVRTNGWILNEQFTYLDALYELLIQVSPLRNNELLRKLSRVGKLKLVIVSGVFIQNQDSRVDLLVVGDNIKRSTLENMIKLIEAELGREIRYASFETADFQYRLSMYDKLIRDILDFEHEKILDKLNQPSRS